MPEHLQPGVNGVVSLHGKLNIPVSYTHLFLSYIDNPPRMTREIKAVIDHDRAELCGEFFTPACVVRTLVEVLQPFKGRVYDPCCGCLLYTSLKCKKSHTQHLNGADMGLDASSA